MTYRLKQFFKLRNVFLKFHPLIWWGKNMCGDIRGKTYVLSQLYTQEVTNFSEYTVHYINSDSDQK